MRIKAVRLILKSLLRAPHDPDNARRLLEGVAAHSTFAPLRRAVEAHTVPAPKELQGPKGPEPTRYGDWEVKGIASDF